MSTFREAINQWLKTRSLSTRPRTREFYQEVAKIILQHWPDADLATHNITAEQVLQFAQKVTQQCPSRWNAIVAALRAVTSHGKLLDRRTPNLRQFTPPNQLQFSAFLKECDELPRTKAGLIVRFLCYTGMRISEARGLKWKHVLADRIEVPGEITKNGKARAIPLLPGATEVLARLKAIKRDDFVLPRQNARKAIEKASKRAFNERWSFHSCRHFFATRCIQSGVDTQTVARWLGHLDGGALLSKTYFHLSDEHSRQMAAKVSILPAAQSAAAMLAGPVYVAGLPSLNFQFVMA